jgi:uncharacterized protein YbjT (DUF2867 family)
MTKTVLVAGATGMLGSQIAQAILDEGAAVRLLLREVNPSDPKKAAKIDDLSAKGAKIVVGELSDAASLERATAGVTSVVSVLQGGPDVLIAGQIALAEAAAANGVGRFIPSDFSCDLFKLPDGSRINLDIRRTADREIAKLPMEMANVLNGGFMEVVLAPFFHLINQQEATVGYFGESSMPLDVTTTADTARFAAIAALEDRAIPGSFGIVGDVITVEQPQGILSKTHAKPFALVRKGSIADLESWIKTEQAEGRAMAWPTIGAQYAWAMMSGRARITEPVNAGYPNVVTTSASEFLERASKRQNS